MLGHQPFWMGLLGQQQGLLGAPGGQTQDLMQQYLQSLFMRRYQPPALMGAQNTVRSQMGPGGLTYAAPVPAAAAVPAQARPTFGSPFGAMYNPDGSFNFNGGFGSPG